MRSPLTVADLQHSQFADSGTTMTPTGLEVFIIRLIAGRDVLEYCPSGLGDIHEATAVHYVFRRDARRQYTVVVASRARATVGAVGRAPKLREA